MLALQPLIGYLDLKSLRNLSQTAPDYFEALARREIFGKLIGENSFTKKCQEINCTLEDKFTPEYGKFLVEAFVLLKLDLIRVEDYNSINRFTRKECKNNSLDFLQAKPNKVILGKPQLAAWPCLALMNRPSKSWRYWNYSELPKHMERMQLPLGMCKRIVRNFIENSRLSILKTSLIKALLYYEFPRSLIEFAIKSQQQETGWIQLFYRPTEKRILVRNAAKMQSPLISNWLVSQRDYTILSFMTLYKWPKLKWRNRRQLKKF